MRVFRFVLFLALCCVPAFAHSEEAELQTKAKSSAPIKVGLFDAIEQGLIEAKIVAKSSLDGRVTVRSKSKVPLQIQLPAAFAAVPLHQFEDMMGGLDGGGMDAGGAGGGRGGSDDGGGGGGGNQSSGGGFGGGMGGMSGGMGGGGGMWNIAPERMVRRDVKMVCLEHGKKEPRRHIPYELRPIETVTDKPEVQMLCSLVGSGAVHQKSAQAAVWHYNNDMSWEELANKRIKERIDSPMTVPYFTSQQMFYAMNLGKKIEEKLAKENEGKKEKVNGGSGE